MTVDKVILVPLIIGILSIPLGCCPPEYGIKDKTAGSQPTTGQEGVSAIQIMTADQIKKAGLNIDKPDAKGILAAWAKCEDIEDFVLPKCSVESIKSVRYGGTQKSGVVAFINRDCLCDPVDIFIAWPGDKGYVCQTLMTVRGNLEDDVADFNNDGQDEIVVRSIMSGPSANSHYWPGVYCWTQNGFVIKNKEFVQTYYVPIYLPAISYRIEETIKSLELNRTNGDSPLYDRYLKDLADCKEALDRVAALARSAAASTKPAQTE